MTDIILDNIIFSLQRSGGASVVWQQHLQRLACDQNFNCSFYEYEDARNNIFRDQLIIDSARLTTYSARFMAIKRYFNLRMNRATPYLFHSSHYRYCKDKKAINISTVHDFTYERFVSGLRQKVHSYQKHQAILHSVSNICVSQSTKSDLLKFVPAVNPDSIHVVYNGVDDGFYQLGDKIGNTTNFDRHQYVLYVGDRQAPYKNFTAAVKSCALFGRPLVMAGGGALSPREDAFLCSTLGAANFQHAGSVTTSILNELYNNAFCLLYPSLYEGFGIPVIEAQKAGCPVIALNQSSIPEIIGQTSFCLNSVSANNLDEAMKLLDSSSSLRQSTIDCGIENAKRFSWQKTYDQTVEIYKQFI